MMSEEVSKHITTVGSTVVLQGSLRYAAYVLMTLIAFVHMDRWVMALIETLQ
ncbi:hypothetical protein [Pararhizobium haloflavum]|uniref:hypothetical protein n=1 Tax=Pararhizobium haloflavum TaxID=2037914 RepID=UPI0012FFF99B|nr:hypothetical protein [Pararhizobium haloflavum]